MRQWTSLLYVMLCSILVVEYSLAGYSDRSLTVDEADGAVKVRSTERWQSPTVGMQMEMPTIASTGTDGRIKLSQQQTVISVAANSTVEILEGPTPGTPMQRVVQDRGSAFYDVAPRGDNKLRVEAAYLVAVVKGTQFNVSVEDDSTTIALFEGQLLIEAPNVGDAVDIVAGQIAKFHRGDLRISVLDMNSGEFIARSDGGSGSGGGNGSTPGTAAGSGATEPGNGAVVASTTGVAVDAGPVGVGVHGTVSLSLKSVNANVATSVDLAGANLSGALTSGIDLSEGEIDLQADAGVALGDTSLELGVGSEVDLADGSLGLDVEVGPADLGIVDVGTDDLDLDVDVDLGLADDVGDTLTDGVDDLLDDLSAGIDGDDESIVDVVPEIDDLVPDPGGLLGL